MLNGKYGLKYAGPGAEAMRAVARAHTDRSLSAFEAALRSHDAELNGDEFVRRHLGDLNETMLEQNLVRLCEPFSRVPVAHIADMIHLPLDRVEPKCVRVTACAPRRAAPRSRVWV